MLARNYNPLLIKLLKKDHQQLFAIYGDILNLLKKNANFTEIQNLLDELKVVLSMHIDFENSQLYSYLKNIYKEDKAKLSFLNGADRDMGEIVDIALRFIDKFSEYEVFIKQKKEFEEELKLIGDVLVDRVGFEENRLYTLYN